MMKKLFITVFIIGLVLQVMGQHAKKPTIMIVPSDRYCISKGYSTTFDNQGTKVTIPDYKKALQSDADLRLVISKMSGIMADRGFPLKDLEQELKNVEQETAETNMLMSKSGSAIAESPIDVLKRVAKADIIMDLDFQVKKQGPRKYIVYTLNGIDAYTGKNIASSSGAGSPSSAATVDLLLEEAVLSHMDEFNGRLMDHFNDMFEKGREVKVMVKVWDGSDIDLEEEYEVNGEEDELNVFIEDWIADHTVEGRYSLSDMTENFMKFEQVRIPMFYERNGKQRAMDTRKFVNNLRKHLAQDPFNITSKVYMRGLGEAWLIVGEK
jgi:hypothetical protein